MSNCDEFSASESQLLAAPALFVETFFSNMHDHDLITILITPCVCICICINLASEFHRHRSDMISRTCYFSCSVLADLDNGFPQTVTRETGSNIPLLDRVYHHHCTDN